MKMMAETQRERERGRDSLTTDTSALLCSACGSPPSLQFCVDLSDPASLLSSRVAFQTTLRSLQGKESAAPLPAIFLALTKHDAPAACSRADVENAFAWVEDEEAAAAGGGGGGVRTFVTSAYSGDGVAELAQAITIVL